MNSYRIFWSGKRGRTPLHFDAPTITRHSVVQVAASEARIDVASQPGLGDAITRFVGDATVEVGNVAPRDGGVTFVVDVAWTSPLDIVTDITVLDPPAETIRAG